MYINFQQNCVSRSVKTCAQICSQKSAGCINSQLYQWYFFKSITSDMHHHKTYMDINFQQNQVCRSVKTVHTNLEVA